MRIGIDLGGTKIEGIVMDPSNQVLDTRRIPTPVRQGYKQILRTIEELVHSLETSVGLQCTVGIGTPGALSATTQTMKNSNTVCLNGKPLKQDLEEMLQREIRIENDANCFALSEATDGAGQDYRVVFGVIMGTGVGGGIVIGKQLHSGPQHIAGEWGHNTLVPNGRDCYCGRKGCVEAYLSGPGLVKQWIEQSGSTEVVTAQEVVQRAQSKDVICQSVMDQYFGYFGQAIASVINILDPDAIVLGGGMSNVNGLYTKGVDQIRHHIFNDDVKTPILTNCHGDSSGVRGAAQLWPSTDE
ncbi:MAG: ROK family protein [Arenicellales bacterium]|nr:ROK family protein [Arenicellales bacterium]